LNLKRTLCNLCVSRMEILLDWRVNYRNTALVLGGSIGSSMPKTSTFSLYLAKPDVTAFDELLTETARTQIEQGRAQRYGL
jgi:hypothetical protein